MIKITNYKDINFLDLVTCMEKLQDFICDVDPFWLNIRKKEYSQIYTNKLIKNILENDWIIYMIYDDDLCVWCIAGTTWFTEDEYINEFKYIKMWNIIELFIDKDYRWQKLWEQLMWKMELYFKEKNCDFVYVDVFWPNIWAYNFYKKFWYSDRMLTLSKKLI